MSTYGPDYEQGKDSQRVSLQLDRIRDFMLERSDWLSLAEIEVKTGDPQASISAQLRHLRKERFGSYIVDKRRRTYAGGLSAGTWEYRVFPPKPPEAVQGELFG